MSEVEERQLESEKPVDLLGVELPLAKAGVTVAKLREVAIFSGSVVKVATRLVNGVEIVSVVLRVDEPGEGAAALEKFSARLRTAQWAAGGGHRG